MLPTTRRGGLQVEEVGTVRVAHLPGPALLDPLLIAPIGDQLAGMVQGAGKRPRLLRDFGQVEHLSSAMLTAVLKLHTRVSAAGGRLALCGLRQHLAEVLRITQMDRLLHVYPGEPEALMSF